MRILLATLIVTSLLAVGCGSDDRYAAEQTSSAPPAATETTTATAPQAPATTPAEPAKEIPAIPRRDTSAEPPDPELFFFFPDEPSAKAAAAELKQHGYRVRTTPPEGEIKQWSVIAEGTPRGDDLKAAEDAFRPWAAARDGKYDGNEIPLGP